MKNKKIDEVEDVKGHAHGQTHKHTHIHKDKKGCGLMEGIEKRERTYEDISGTTLMRIPEVGVL